jgi:hypothetical protein
MAPCAGSWLPLCCSNSADHEFLCVFTAIIGDNMQPFDAPCSRLPDRSFPLDHRAPKRKKTVMERRLIFPAQRGTASGTLMGARCNRPRKELETLDDEAARALQEA